MSPRRFTAPAAGSGGCRPADLHGRRTHGRSTHGRSTHGRGVLGGAWEGAATRGVRDRVIRCRLWFWAGTGRRPGRGQRGSGPSGTGA